MQLHTHRRCHLHQSVVHRGVMIKCPLAARPVDCQLHRLASASIIPFSEDLLLTRSAYSQRSKIGQRSRQNSKQVSIDIRATATGGHARAGTGRPVRERVDALVILGSKCGV